MFEWFHKTIDLKTTTIEGKSERIRIKDLRGNPLVFWDIENQGNYNYHNVEGEIFIVGRISASTINKSMCNLKNTEMRRFHIFDTQTINKDYADIVTATLVGEILSVCKTLTKVTLISADKGFESIQYFLNRNGICAVEIDHIKVSNLKSVSATSSVLVDYKLIEKFKVEVNKRFIPHGIVNTKSVRKVATSIGLNESNMMTILRKYYSLVSLENGRKLQITA